MAGTVCGAEAATNVWGWQGQFSRVGGEGWARRAPQRVRGEHTEAKLWSAARWPSRS